VSELIFISRSSPRDNIAALAWNRYGFDVSIRLVLRLELGRRSKCPPPIKASVGSLGECFQRKGDPGVIGGSRWVSD
jgi:hypothetical protein